MQSISKRHTRVQLVLVLLFMFLVAGCTQSGTTSSPTPTVPPATPTPSLPPNTPTPIPTLEPDQAWSLAYNLLQTNGDCRLPCLMGLVPGQTSYQDVQDFVEQFGELRTQNVYSHVSKQTESGEFTLTYRENHVHTNVSLSYYIKTGNLYLASLHGYALHEEGTDLEWLNQNVSPLYGGPYFNQVYSGYLLPGVLTNYGSPEQILLDVLPDDPDHEDVNWHPFSLVLMYSQQDFMVEYVFQSEQKGENYVGCPSESELSVTAWAPDQDVSLAEIVGRGGLVIDNQNMDSYKPIDEVTSYTAGDFYQVFKDSSQVGCIETPIKYWQNP